MWGYRPPGSSKSTNKIWRYEDIVENEKFRNLIDGVHTYVWNQGGRSSGKSVATWREIIYKIMSIKNQSVLCVRDTLASHKDSTFSEAKKQLDYLGIQYEAKVSPIEIILSNGTQIFFRGLDDPVKIKSIIAEKPIGCVLFEEATGIASRQHIQMVTDSVRGVEQPYFIFNYNPDDETHFIREKVKPKNLRPNEKHIISTIYDNKFNTKEFIARIEDSKEYNIREYNIRALGLWQTLGTKTYQINPDINFFNPEITQPEKMFFHNIAFGIDIGEEDATTFVAIGFSENFNRVHVLEQYYHSNGEVAHDKDKKTLVEFRDDFINFYSDVVAKYQPAVSTVDIEYATGGKSLINLIRNHPIGCFMDIKEAIKYQIKDRVRSTNFMLNLGILVINDSLTYKNGCSITDEFKDSVRDLDKTNDEYWRCAKNDHGLAAFDYAMARYTTNIGMLYTEGVL